MTDRELLEAAAKAARLALTWGEKYKLGDDIIDCTDISYAASNQPDESDVHWDPLNDDGDALRLAVKLKLNIMQGDFSASVDNEAEIDKSALVRNEEERAKIVRRLIVLSAAAMVKP
jgi:hypothetical protein